jgi:hypothetical protein
MSTPLYVVIVVIGSLLTVYFSFKPYLPMIYAFFIGDKKKEAFLKENGIEATATVIKTEPTGVTINQMPQMKFFLDIIKKDASKIQMESIITISPSKYYLMAPGSQFKILYDPKDVSNFIMI